MMGSSGTFDYVIEVPDGGRASLPWSARLRTPVEAGECVAITLPRVCPDCAATLTAPLLDSSDALEIR
jgi:hypothetical protein